MKEKSLREIMTPMQDVHAFSVERCMDHRTMAEMVHVGHSRIPVYAGEHKSNICGLLLVKRLIALSPDDARCAEGRAA